MKYEKRKSDGCRIWQSKKGWFYLGIGGHIYVLHLEIGPFGLTWNERRKKS